MFTKSFYSLKCKPFQRGAETAFEKNEFEDWILSVAQALSKMTEKTVIRKVHFSPVPPTPSSVLLNYFLKSLSFSAGVLGPRKRILTTTVLV